MISSFFIVGLLVVLMAGNVAGDRMIRFVFNDGITPMPGDECTVNDNRFIDPLFNITAYLRTRRNLKSALSDVADPNDHEYNYYHHRELYPAYCKDNCIGFARGTCRATGCLGYRRSLLAAVDQNHREEFTPCDIQIAGIHWALDALISTNKVSEPCQRYLTKSKRKTECYDDVIYGEIDSFTFYNMNVNRAKNVKAAFYGIMASNVQNGYKFCSNIPFNAEVVLNPCVHMVNFTLTGADSYKYTRIDTNHPMILFNTTVHASTYGGRFLTPGSYKLWATPDNYDYKQKTLDFTVIAC
jgi:hypothetical protein